MEALEEEGSAAKRQMSAMHQQRIMSIINMRKKAAMDCYTAALDQATPKVWITTRLFILKNWSLKNFWSVYDTLK